MQESLKKAIIDEKYQWLAAMEAGEIAEYAVDNQQDMLRLFDSMIYYLTQGEVIKNAS